MTIQNRTEAELAHTERLEVVEERLIVGKRQEERVVRIHQRPVERTERVSLPLESQDVRIERVPMDRYVDEIPPVREEDGVTIIPLVEEVVSVRLRLYGEVRVSRETRTDVYEQDMTLRRTDVQVENATQEDHVP